MIINSPEVYITEQILIMKKILAVIVICCIRLSSTAQHISELDEQAWVDSVFATLSDDEKLGQLMVVRLSSMGSNRKVTFYDEAVAEAINKYNVGGICLFQGGPVTQAKHI